MRVMPEMPAEMSIRDLRARLADVINDAAVYGRTTFITNRGRRVAAIVAVPIAEGAGEGGSPGHELAAIAQWIEDDAADADESVREYAASVAARVRERAWRAGGHR